MSFAKRSKNSMRLKELVYRVAPTMIRDQIGVYLRCLKEGRACVCCMCMCVCVCLYVCTHM